MGPVIKNTDSIIERLKKFVPIEVIVLFSTVAALFGFFEEIIFAQVMTFVVMGAGIIIALIVENRRWDEYIKEKKQCS